LKSVAIVGGGLAGLVFGIELSKKGVPCTLFEKKSFPFHKVCGEYVSNEVIPYLQTLDIFPEALNAGTITHFQLSSVRGHSATMPLDLGGFAVSRFMLDNFLAQLATSNGVQLRQGCDVENINFDADQFTLSTTQGEFKADMVLGAFGKRSRLDIKLDRPFVKTRSPFVAVKYHVKNTTHPDHIVALHNFPGGYCGMVNIENGLTNICYLASRDNFKQHKSIDSFETNVLAENPLLREALDRTELVFERPLVINEISFQTKSPVENHILMAGDSAGMITPLCGNGMAIAIHSAKIAAACTYDFCNNRISRLSMERRYEHEWRQMFATRLRIGRAVQKLFGSPFISSMSVNLMLRSPKISGMIMKYTHGQPF
jgi:menaquinone-9 beta-reductase